MIIPSPVNLSPTLMESLSAGRTATTHVDQVVGRRKKEKELVSLHKNMHLSNLITAKS